MSDLVLYHAVPSRSMVVHWMLEEVGVPVTLLTGSLSGAGRSAALEAIASGQAQVVVGTPGRTLDHIRMSVAEDQWAPRTHVVHVGVAVGVDHRLACFVDQRPGQLVGVDLFPGRFVAVEEILLDDRRGKQFIEFFVFGLGGLTGLFLGNVTIDLPLSDTYFVVAHFHYVLFAGTAMAVFGGIYFWFPKMFGQALNETMGKLHFWLTFIGFHTTFLVQHWLGNEGMPRRYADYLPSDGFTTLNVISTIGAFVLGVVVFAVGVGVYFMSTASSTP